MALSWLRTLSWSLVLVPATAQIFSCKDDTVWPSSADGQQNPSTATSNYVEWWFFTAFSAKEDVGVALSYSPKHSSVSAMVYENAASAARANVTDIHRQFNTSSVGSHNATQSFGTDSTTGVTVIDERTYLVTGSMPEHGLHWSLTYTQQVDPAREHVDILGAIALDWVSYMPSATVRGEITYKGKSHKFTDGLGYHDHNSGKWPKKKGAVLVAEEKTTAASALDATDASALDATALDASALDATALDASALPSFDYKWGSVYGGTSGIGGVYVPLPPPLILP